ncbi:hypothetical protein ACM67B_05590 [Neisseria sp. CCUG17229]|uniref:ACP-like domain-containing protein n=1 Tax=Neisseria sp. CCUG17229 TaxID=3392036 RepID=UPI003A0FBFF6
MSMHLLSISALSIVFAAISPIATANNNKPVKAVDVRFRLGTSSITYKGSVRGYQFDSYRFYAKKGQVLNINYDTSDKDIDVSVRYLGKSSDNEFLTTVNQILPFTGFYEVRVFQTRNGARKNNNLRPYVVTLAITNTINQTALHTAQLGTINNNWIDYECHDGERVTVHYKISKAIATAEVKINGKIFNMKYDSESNSDITVFSGQGYQWSVNNSEISNIHRANNGFLTQNKMVLINGKREKVNQIIRKNCTPIN